VGQDRVKYRAVFSQKQGKVLGWGLLLMSLGVGGGFSTQVWAQGVPRKPPPPRSFLLGGGAPPPKFPVLLDPVLPRGYLRRSPHAFFMKFPLCSLLRPVCVDGPSSLSANSKKRSLNLLESSYEEHVMGAGRSAPFATRARPLVWHLDPFKDLSLEVEPLASRGFDRGRALCRGGIMSRETARRCITAAAVVALSPGTAPWLRDGYSAGTSLRLGDAPVSASALRESFRFPHLGVLSSSRAFSPLHKQKNVNVSRLRSARFFSYLEKRSLDKQGSAGWLALTLGATRTSPGASRWNAEPDIGDILFATLDSDITKVARLFDDFSQESYFESSSFGSKIEPTWTLEGKTLPRSIALPQPIEPTGAAYVLTQLTRAQQNKIVVFRMKCELPVSYVWSVARLDKKGRTISRRAVPYRQRGGDAATSVQPVEGTESLLLVGTNMGGIDLAHAFDPDHGPHEAHGCSIAVNILADDEGAKK